EPWLHGGGGDSQVRKGTLALGPTADQALPPDRAAAVPSQAMAIPADKVTAESAAAQSQETWRGWSDHVARTTAVLAVLAAVASGSYANQFSRTILAQAEASDQWSYYQAKSIKRSIVTGQIELLKALATTAPQAAAALDKLQADDIAAVKKYVQEMDELKAQADTTEKLKRL